jgi:lactoylglutathione lyase
VSLSVPLFTPADIGWVAPWPLVTVSRLKTLHTAYRVTDLATSLHFHAALGYEEVGRIDIVGGASLTVLKFPGEDVVTLELVHQPADGSVDLGTRYSHIVVQVENLACTIRPPSRSGLRPEPTQRPGSYRVELVEWPAGHPDGITEADFD